MYAYLRGIAAESGVGYVVIDVGGVGYKVFTCSEFPEGEVKAYTHLHIREGAMELYGFLQKAQLEAFQRLITVAGVGPKVALAVLAAMSPSELVLNVISDNAKELTRVSGIGKKTAQRIILELRDKMKNDDYSMAAEVATRQPEPVKSGGSQQAYQALISLGYTQQQARQALSSVESGLSVEDTIKQALKTM